MQVRVKWEKKKVGKKVQVMNVVYVWEQKLRFQGKLYERFLELQGSKLSDKEKRPSTQ